MADDKTPAKTYQELVKITYTMSKDVTQLITDGTLPSIQELTSYIRKHGVDANVKRLLDDAVHTLGYAILISALDDLAANGLTPIQITALNAVMKLKKEDG